MDRALSTASCCIALTLSCAALAQTPPEPVVPTNYMWANQPSGVANDEHFAEMIALDVHNRYEYPTPNDPDPEDAADIVCDDILASLSAGRITPGTVCVILRGFGHDWRESDPLYPGGSPWLARLGFFDTTHDALPGLTRGDFPDPPPAANPTLLERLDAREWRQPFVRNATQASQLKTWMQTFVARCKARHVANSALPHPSTWKWYLDSEPFLYWTGNRNGVKVPRVLADEAGTSGSIWDAWPVPGSTGWSPPTSYPLSSGETRHGETLAEMWADAVTAYGFPSNPAAAFNPLLRADHEDNREAMIWWAWLAQRALDATFDHCYYGVLRAELGGNVACGNYNTANYDGVIDESGWYTSPSASWPSGSPFVTNDMPRCWIDPQPSYLVPLLTRHTVAGGTYRPWHSVAQHASGSRASPELYPMNCAQLDGLVRLTEEDPPCSSNIGLMGHRQANLYEPGAPAESDLQATLRLHRHIVESIINSNGGGRETSLTPWVAQYMPDQTQTDPLSFYTGEAQKRAFFAFGRGVNIPEYIHWTGTADAAAQAAAWRHTADLMKRVYCTRIVQIKPMASEVSPSTAYPDLEPLMLEYTLRDRVTDDAYTADLVPADWSSLNATMLRVTFEGLNDYPPAPSFQCGDGTCLSISYEFTIEGRVLNTSGMATGSVEFLLLPGHCPNEPESLCYVPVHEFAVVTPDGSFRTSFTHPNLTPYVAESGEFMLRIVLKGGTSAIKTRYDLAQVIPFWECPSCTAGEESASSAYATSDLNADFVVNQADADLFVGALIADDALADVNADGVLDGADVVAFEASYVASAP